MGNWGDGYVTDVSYVQGYDQEATPAWLAMAALMTGQRPPDLTRPFRYADLGCGNGATAMSIAASCPDAEIWGFDFNPAHIETAQRSAAQAGLTNVTFLEVSFAELAAWPDSRLPGFDFIVAHGVWSWISSENRQHLTEVFRRRLRPGGLAYLSYNTAAGWAAMGPVRELMRVLAAAAPQRSDLAIPRIFDAIDRLREAGAHYFRANPGIEPLLAGLRQRDPRYLAHEFLNDTWQPATFSDVADAMAQAKCSFIGSATLSDNIEMISIPSGVIPLLEETQDTRLKETLRDLAGGQSFRRDIYRRGRAPLLPGEQRAMLEALSIVGLGAPVQDEIAFTQPFGTMKVKSENFRPILEAIQSRGISFREAQELGAATPRSLKDTMRSFAMLVAAGFAAPLLPGAPGASARRGARMCNLAVAEGLIHGGEATHLVAPAIGAAIRSGPVEVLVVQSLLLGGPAVAEPIVAHVRSVLDHSVRMFAHDGRELTDPHERTGFVESQVAEILDRRCAAFRTLGILD